MVTLQFKMILDSPITWSGKYGEKSLELFNSTNLWRQHLLTYIRGITCMKAKNRCHIPASDQRGPGGPLLWTFFNPTIHLARSTPTSRSNRCKIFWMSRKRLKIWFLFIFFFYSAFSSRYKWGYVVSGAGFEFPFRKKQFFRCFSIFSVVENLLRCHLFI
jgi:hypothetical protein